MIIGWMKSIPIACYILMAGFIIYSTFFAPAWFVDSNWWFVAGMGLFWGTYFGWHWLVKARASKRP